MVHFIFDVVCSFVQVEYGGYSSNVDLCCTALNPTEVSRGAMFSQYWGDDGLLAF